MQECVKIDTAIKNKITETQSKYFKAHFYCNFLLLQMRRDIVHIYSFRNDLTFITTFSKLQVAILEVAILEE